MPRDRKAIALFSGGLDSILTVFFMRKLGYTVFPVFFQTPYLPADKALYAAQANGMEIIVKDVTHLHLQMLKNPRYGFGKNINPCIDCHALMFQIAGDMLGELGADFLISGEVLGQRPMSQRRDALFAVKKTCGYGDLLIRPLSHALLDDTLPIREGWVDKAEMLSINGRGRQAQKALATELGVKYYPQSGGGCLLTDVSYTLRMKDLLELDQADVENIELLKYGRHFRLTPEVKLIVGRDEADNNAIQANATKGTFLLVKDHFGPLGYVNSEDPQILELAANIYLYYCKKAPTTWDVNFGKDFAGTMSATKSPNAVIAQYIIAADKENICSK
jgi:tRNA U34 2-thiouridine synthase MnmA/TrmU